MTRSLEQRARAYRVFTDLGIQPAEVKAGQILTEPNQAGVTGFTEVPALFRGDPRLVVARYRMRPGRRTMLDVVKGGALVGEKVAADNVHCLRTEALNAGTIQVATIAQIRQHPEGERLLTEAAVATANRLAEYILSLGEPLGIKTLRALRELADSEGLVLVNQAAVAQRAGASRRAMHPHLDVLEGKGLIRREGERVDQTLHIILDQEKQTS